MASSVSSRYSPMRKSRSAEDLHWGYDLGSRWSGRSIMRRGIEVDSRREAPSDHVGPLSSGPLHLSVAQLYVTSSEVVSASSV